MDNLNPCPFCGSTDVQTEVRDVSELFFWNVICQFCEAQGPDAGTENGAIKAWNIRNDSGAVEAGREENNWKDSALKPPDDGQKVVFYTPKTGLRLGEYHIITGGRSMYTSRYIDLVGKRVWWLPLPELPAEDISDIDDVNDFSFKGRNR